MAAQPVLRWGLTLSVAAALVALALALTLQQQQQQQGAQQPLTAPSPPAASTHCYTRVRTHDAGRPAAQCFSVAGGRFQRVWSREEGGGDGDDDDDDAGDEQGASLADGYAIPGLWDGHGHLLQYGQFLHSVDLFGSQSLDDVRSRLRAYLAANPDAGTKDQWVRGVGWDQTAFGRMPTAADIEQDDQLRGIYMMLDRIDVHCSWVSQAVLDLLPAPVPDVPGGEVVRDPGMGVFCDNAADLVLQHYPQPSRAAKAAAVRSAMARLNQLGLVGMHDAGATPDTLRMYADLADGADDDDGWTLRVYAMMECDPRNSFCPDDAVRISRDDDRLTVRSVKLFADGALGSWGSAMLEPYSDHPWTSGSLLINASALTDVTKAWAAAGYQVNIHAIGDLANRNAVDAFEAALRQQCPPDDSDGDSEEAHLAACQAAHRFRIEHSQIIHPDDQRRIHALGLIPSIQPTHATSDMKYALSRLGPARLADSAYRMRSLLGARPVLGSDFPVEPPDPFQGIYAALARRSPHTGLGPDGSAAAWHPEEALSLDEALWGFTGGAAYGAFMEDRAGVIQPGALADWVVLDQAVEDMDVESFRDVKVRETWVGGKRVFARKS